jgi:hypothetical protein
MPKRIKLATGIAKNFALAMSLEYHESAMDITLTLDIRNDGRQTIKIPKKS